MLLITGARMGQTHGYKRLFLIGVALFATTSVACGLAPDAGALIAARVVQGAGAAMMFPQTMTGIQLHFGGRARTRAIGLYAVALSAGAVTLMGHIMGGVAARSAPDISGVTSTTTPTSPPTSATTAAGLTGRPSPVILPTS
jgi:MFS family permease